MADISENLISLRRFVDVDSGIYLDNNELKIFEKETGKTLLTSKATEVSLGDSKKTLQICRVLKNNRQVFFISTKVLV